MNGFFGAKPQQGQQQKPYARNTDQGWNRGILGQSAPATMPRNTDQGWNRSPLQAMAQMRGAMPPAPIPQAQLAQMRPQKTAPQMHPGNTRSLIARMLFGR